VSNDQTGLAGGGPEGHREGLVDKAEGLESIALQRCRPVRRAVHYNVRERSNDVRRVLVAIVGDVAEVSPIRPASTVLQIELRLPSSLPRLA